MAEFRISALDSVTFVRFGKSKQLLSRGELKTFEQASQIYHSKAFEYIEVQDAATKFRRFPDLESLDSGARKLINARSMEEWGYASFKTEVKKSCPC